ncbi:MAG UNVERIFIED_CONTAM: hypothetical protein LVR29_20840 [Microcystis novacekii LVE1205-3]
MAAGSRNKAIINAPELRWLPRTWYFNLPKGMEGSHLQLEAKARQGRYDTRRQEKLQLQGTSGGYRQGISCRPANRAPVLGNSATGH